MNSVDLLAKVRSKLVDGRPYKAKTAAIRPNKVMPAMPTSRRPSAEEEDDADAEELVLEAVDEPEESEVPDASEEESEVLVAVAAEPVAVEPEASVDWAGVPVEVK